MSRAPGLERKEHADVGGWVGTGVCPHCGRPQQTASRRTGAQDKPWSGHSEVRLPAGSPLSMALQGDRDGPHLSVTVGMSLLLWACSLI